MFGRKTIGALVVAVVVVGGVVGQAEAAAITAADLDYGISNKRANSFYSDFSSQTVWTAGS